MAWSPWFIRRRRDRERQDEFDSHLAHHIDDLVGRGVEPAEARRQARLLLGNTRARREELDEMQRASVCDAIWRDLRYAVRVLRRTPAFTATSIVTLALVIGANTAVFSLANGLLLQPLPYPDSGRLYLVEATFTSPRGQFRGTSVDGFVWEALRRTPQRDQAAVFSDMSTGVNLALNNQAFFVDQQRVGAGFFRTLGVAPAIGREFTDAEDRPGGPPVVVLNHDLWRRAFDSDPQVLGSTILLRGEPWEVIGAMPEGFRSTADADVWTPLRPSTTGEGGGTNYAVVLRVPAGTPATAVQAELRPALDPALREQGLRPDTQATIGLRSLQDAMTAGSREVIIMLAAAATTLLVIACVNLAALLLARGGSRSKELATRMALGSGRGAVVRQLMVESLVVAAVGGACGVAVGWFGLEGLQALAGDRFADWQRVTIDGRVVAMCGGLALITSVLFGLVPAWQASRLDVQTALVEGGSRAIAGGARPWMRRSLIVAEVALGVVLLVTAGLLTRTVVNLRGLDPGINLTGLVTATVSLLDARYPSPVEVNQLFNRTLERLSATDGVEAAAVSLGLPFERVLNMGFRYPGAESGFTSSVMYVSPEFFDTFEIATRQGRLLESRDTPDTAPVVVVNQSFERIYSKDQPVLGRRLRVAGVEREVVGVVADIQQRPGFVVDGMVPGPIVSSPAIYLPASQISQGIVGTHVWFPPVFTVRASSPALGEQAIRQAVSAADPLLPLGVVRQMTDVRAEATAQEEMLMTLVGILAVAALLLMAVGLHGVIAHAVTERTREFGIRLALGATPAGTVRAVTLSGVGLAAIGAVLGTALAAPASSLVASVLYGVAERDPLTYVAAGAFLLVVATIASLIPALRILRLDPATTLRS